MNIHDKINYKEFYKSWRFVERSRLITFFKPDVDDYAINYSIKLFNLNEQSKMVHSGRNYCHDCSVDSRQERYHYNDSPKYLKPIKKGQAK